MTRPRMILIISICDEENRSGNIFTAEKWKKSLILLPSLQNTTENLLEIAC